MFLETILWLAENAWTLLLHLSGKSSFPRPLKPAEEQALLEKKLAGDEAAEEKLIEHNLRLVAHIAKKYYGSGVDQDDLVSVGSIGLIKAVHTFRPEAGKLTAYASRCIENEILMYLRANRKNRGNVLLGEPIGTDKEGNEIQLLDLLGTEKDALEEEVENSIEARRALAKLSEVLDAREKQVIVLRYGLAGDAPQPQHEVARTLGISRSYVSRIEKKALGKLREALER